MNKTYICRGGPVWPPVILFIEIYEYPYKFMTFARMLGRPRGFMSKFTKKLTHSKTVI